MAQLDEAGHVKHVAQTAVASPGQPVAQMLAAGCVDRSGAGPGREVVAVGEPGHITNVGQDPRGSALIVSGRVERLDGAVSLLTSRLRPIKPVAAVPSRDFR